MRNYIKVLTLFFLCNLTSCSSNSFQSLWHPASASARELKNLSVVLFVMSFIVFTVVCLLLFLALKKDSGLFRLKPGNKFIIVSGFIIPTIILTGILIYSLRTSVNIRSGSATGAETLQIKVIGHQWWWEVHYPDHKIITANEIFIPAGVPVNMELTSRDVIHSFWIPNVQGKMDMIPGVTTRLGLQVDNPGEYRGQCAEFCGLQHALMAFPLVVLSREDFKVWVKKSSPKKRPILSVAAIEGEKVFFKAACNACHRIEGTEAKGLAGPDLTLLAERKTLGSGSLPNNHHYLSRWILDSQKLKPLNRMPPTELTPEELKFLLVYLETLK